MFRKLFGKEATAQPSSDRFKSLIHSLSAMTEEELVKVERLLELVFYGKERSLAKTDNLITEAIQPPESSLDEQIEEARAQLKTDELEKKIEQFRKNKKSE
ncbi:TPA: hypothetical protein ACGYRP_000328 [Streptococcus pyogenes]|uniref:hypothetical protein n=1 Tax=Streptococcus pyogenes TaxID=1314 RepID=UPI00109D0863|nr:hypothetical protein [Streptococcus pyogenes]QCK38902.1 hypothetical protein ETT65_05010 [Streptococcus pyogenes]VGT90661.1 ATPases with chaperone activity, ATP-binding subunit [Streptococcus pyogenes]VGV98027.1 ATPases with chaperone activity, ATP-binding subunit [Streptococcus pyogenes]VGW88815.1 ATPases with chaperone activity, ATP-binding subunit [Streptococcus pyogenes]VGZ97529.1 ATPases with chaperone activity, ATP-binding subunit [Streptococcus pyogenes]